MSKPSPVIAAFDRASVSYDNVGVDFFTPMGAALVEAVAPTPGSLVLDVGCGRGAVLFPAADAAGPTGHVTGIDLAPGMVSRTAAAAADRPNVTVALGDAQAPAFPAGSFDVVTAGLVLFFLPDPAGALAAYRRLLRPGGRLGLTAFAAHDAHFRRAMRILAAHAPTPPPEFRPPAMFDSAESLGAALSAAQFSRTAQSELAVPSVFADVDRLLAWIGSHHGRTLLEKVPAGRLAEARAAVAAELAFPLTITTRIHIVVGSV